MDLQAESQIRETLRRLDSDSERGLPQRVVRERLRGRKSRSTHPFIAQASHLLRPIRSPMAIVQFTAGLTLAVAGLYAEAGAVAIVMAINVVARSWCHRVFSRSRSTVCGSASVIRDGRLTVVPASVLVPGDVVRLRVGDIVPADGRIIEAIDLTVEQVSVMGQRTPVRKWALELDDPSRRVEERPSAVFAGSEVISGHGTFVVCGSAGDAPPARLSTHAVVGKLRSLELYLAAMAGTSSLICLAMGWLRNYGTDQSLAAVASVVVASGVPVPALVSVAFALGARQMARAGVSVRDVSKVEELAGVTAICTDEAPSVWHPQTVVSTLWSDRTTLMRRSQGYAMRVEPSPTRNRSVSPLRGIVLLFDILCLCDDSVSPPERTGASGQADPQGEVFLDAARLAGIDVGARRRRLPRLAETRSSARAEVKTTLHRAGNATWQCLSRGPLEAVLRCCSHEVRGGTVVPLTEERTAAIVETARRLAGATGTVTAGATRTWQRPSPGDAPTRHKSPTIFVGFAVLSPSNQSDSPVLLAKCREAGIKVVTLSDESDDGALSNDATPEVFSAAALDALDDVSLDACVERVDTVRGATRAHWDLLIGTLRRSGHTVLTHRTAKTHGPRSDVAYLPVQANHCEPGGVYQAADLVLLKGGLSTLLPAIAEARRCAANASHGIRFLLAGVVGATLAIVIAMPTGLTVPFAPVHLLLLSFTMALLPTIALACAPAASGPMKSPPARFRGNVLSRGIGAHALWMGAFAAAVTVCALHAGLAEGGDQYGRTMAVVAFAAFQCGHALSLLKPGPVVRGRSGTESLTALLLVALGLVLTFIAVYARPLATAAALSQLSARDAFVCAATAALMPALVRSIITRLGETHLNTASSGERGPR